MAKSWTVSGRFHAAFAAIGAGLATSAALVGLLAGNAENGLRMAKDGTEGAVALAAAQSALWELRYGFPQYMVSDPAGRDKILADEPKLRSRIEGAFKKYESTTLTEAEKKFLASLREVFGKYMDARPKWFALYGADKLDEAKAWRAETIAPLGAGTVKGLSELIELQKQVVQTHHEEAAETLAAATQRNRIVLLAIITLAAIAGWMQRRSIVHQLGGEPVRGIETGSERIRTAAQEVARRNLNLSSRTEQQASSLQETASSMEQITGNVRRAADNAQQANKLAQAASNSVERGGEQGRGFAVVAAEVRTLAQRSADAAREIRQLIRQSTAKVGDGSHQVAEASEAMREILTTIRNASTMMSEIAAGTAEQLAGIEQVNQAVMQRDAVTQQSAALVEGASAAAQSMEQHSPCSCLPQSGRSRSDAVREAASRRCVAVSEPARRMLQTLSAFVEPAFEG